MLVRAAPDARLGLGLAPLHGRFVGLPRGAACRRGRPAGRLGHGLQRRRLPAFRRHHAQRRAHRQMGRLPGHLRVRPAVPPAVSGPRAVLHRRRRARPRRPTRRPAAGRQVAIPVSAASIPTGFAGSACPAMCAAMGGAGTTANIRAARGRATAICRPATGPTATPIGTSGAGATAERRARTERPGPRESVEDAGAGSAGSIREPRRGIADRLPPVPLVGTNRIQQPRRGPEIRNAHHPRAPLSAGADRHLAPARDRGDRRAVSCAQARGRQVRAGQKAVYRLSGRGARRAGRLQPRGRPQRRGSQAVLLSGEKDAAGRRAGAHHRRRTPAQTPRSSANIPISTSPW